MLSCRSVPSYHPWWPRAPGDARPVLLVLCPQSALFDAEKESLDYSTFLKAECSAKDVIMDGESTLERLRVLLNLYEYDISCNPAYLHLRLSGSRFSTLFASIRLPDLVDAVQVHPGPPLETLLRLAFGPNVLLVSSTADLRFRSFS